MNKQTGGNMVTGRVLEVNKAQTKQGKDIYYVNVESGGKTVKYQCWDAAIADKQGKDVSFEVKAPPEGTTFAPTLVLPKGDGSTGFQKKAWNGGKPATDPEIFILAYKKDTMLKCVDIALTVSGRSDKFLDVNDICRMAVEAYKQIGTPLFAKAHDAAEKS
jgi:hypothetical protein